MANASSRLKDILDELLEFREGEVLGEREPFSSAWEAYWEKYSAFVNEICREADSLSVLQELVKKALSFDGEPEFQSIVARADRQGSAQWDDIQAVKAKRRRQGQRVSAEWYKQGVVGLVLGSVLSPYVMLNDRVAVWEPHLPKKELEDWLNSEFLPHDGRQDALMLMILYEWYGARRSTDKVLPDWAVQAVRGGLGRFRAACAQAWRKQFSRVGVSSRIVKEYVHKGVAGLDAELKRRAFTVSRRAARGVYAVLRECVPAAGAKKVKRHARPRRTLEEKRVRIVAALQAHHFPNGEWRPEALTQKELAGILRMGKKAQGNVSKLLDECFGKKWFSDKYKKACRTGEPLKGVWANRAGETVPAEAEPLADISGAPLDAPIAKRGGKAFVGTRKSENS
jgi:hypothetical protein